MKPSIYICGDSFVDWDMPEAHWTNYLSNHYNVIKLGKFGADNHSILYQTGLIPKYEYGDRLVIVFSAPGRFPRRFFGERETHHHIKYFNWEWYKDKQFAKKLLEVRLSETSHWLNGERNNEILFLKKLKELYNDFSPVFVTWNEDFHKMTSDFVELIQVTSIADEGGDPMDWHPGWEGCYEFYKKMHTFLDIKDDLVAFQSKTNKII
jgi:hypothetical protein